MTCFVEGFTRTLPRQGVYVMCVDLLNKSKTCSDFSFQQGCGSLRSVATDRPVQRRLQTDGDTNIYIYYIYMYIYLSFLVELLTSGLLMIAVVSTFLPEP